MKKLLPVIVVLIVIALGWLYFSPKKTAVAPSVENGGVASSEKVASEKGTSQTEEQGSLVSSIKDAMGLGKKMACTYTTVDEKGKSATSTIVVDGQKYKFTATANGETAYGIFDGDTQYMWSSGATKQGLKMSKTCIDELGKASQDGGNNTIPTPETPQDFEKSFGEAQGVNCVPSNDDFSVPADVKFVDQCEMMRQATKMMEGVKGNLPAGVNIPGY